MKTFWKVLGFAALAAGLTPYKVDKDEETGEKSYQALLWSGSSKRNESKNIDIRINLGEGTLTSKVKDVVDKKKEAHLFSDELCVDYHGADEEEDIIEAEDTAVEEETVAPETEAAPAVTEAPAGESEAAADAESEDTAVESDESAAAEDAGAE